MGLIFTFSLVIAVVIGYQAIRQLKKRQRKKKLKQVGACWSIGYQWLDNPLALQPHTAKTYSKYQLPEGSSGAADPFVIESDGQLYLFFELILQHSEHAKIAVSRHNTANDDWEYLGIALDEPFHLSYPYVFKHENNIYMLPETKGAQSVRLYRATGFPLQWALEKTLISGKKLVDPSLIEHEGLLYLFASHKRRLYLYFSTSLHGEWQAHPANPIKRWNYARCAGRVLRHNDQLYRFAQEQAKGYGTGVKLYHIRELSPTRYKETPVSDTLLLQAHGNSWAQYGMHHVDIAQHPAYSPQHSLAVFDGRGVPEQLPKPNDSHAVENG